jgi:UDP-3-O-[3-hydroxymyristoyl] N-acetylglucosamine deacetylase
MFSSFQGTIKQKTIFAGVGLHSGKVVNLEIWPSSPNTGIIFHRTDRMDARPILAHPYNVTSTDLCTAIGTEGSAVSTIEHLMAAFAGLGIDNAYVRVDSSEIPILDGSSAPYVDKFRAVGIERSAYQRRQFIVRKSFEIRNGESFIRVDPFHKLQFSCVINFDNSRAIGRQKIEQTFGEDSFLEICEARTFCHINDVNSMRALGLARGGSLDNAIVVNDDAVINADGLRYPDEFVRHKLLDCIGDLALLGGRLIGKVTMNRSGHAMNARFTAGLVKEQGIFLDVVDSGRQAHEPVRENGVEGLGLAAQHQISIA